MRRSELNMSLCISAMPVGFYVLLRARHGLLACELGASHCLPVACSMLRAPSLAAVQIR